MGGNPIGIVISLDERRKARQGQALLDEIAEKLYDASTYYEVSVLVEWVGEVLGNIEEDAS